MLESIDPINIDQDIDSTNIAPINAIDSTTNGNTPVIQALFGGTFDPIHYGHLRPVEALAQLVGLKQVILLPNHVPPHRPQPEATTQQRLEMVRLAVRDNPLFTVDTRELERQAPSYTVETLKSFRQEIGEQHPLAFIIGQDSLQTIHTWYKWEELLDICHLLVCSRPGYQSQLSAPGMQSWFEKYQIDSPLSLSQKPHGYIYLAATPLLNISATDIRQRHLQGISCDDLLPPSIQNYIDSQGLYKK
ncbi:MULTISPECIES: nicotinate-nucleotide adenylyltransferase [Xenorhabdus]|uniref:Probable nicotinate-nucleotide adenylyltransferase n=1 Tax=Xenorhabdus ehlersii TaxID=290111 RepID=A0A2D0IXX9_9GAMM|nr:MULTISPECIES: nicotinate-nucleotide adenylyltransferase [Xenorhabdus]MBC8947915.1 nicotinate-nicotinamide nucleotide adenylyltransferase [Xenorhabdus sp. TS4]PHM25199.1 nicotinate-nicotinamide nucleotide adenylyltransferase [Xenorhabdus ehlersii]PHM26776.1 nicotinate-nicotinamide nucleotide adenylyltransferase [Xenorhabdus ehlersii]RKE90329.1 nicotinate-nucleotide adenylyltransferase [Xenorhabdus ehlersii]